MPGKLRDIDLYKVES